jgi:hypothetical protein
MYWSDISYPVFRFNILLMFDRTNWQLLRVYNSSLIMREKLETIRRRLLGSPKLTLVSVTYKDYEHT